MNYKLLMVVVLLLLSVSLVSASPDYLNRSVNEVVFPEYTFTHLSLTGTLNPKISGGVSLGEDALRFADAYLSGTVHANIFNGTTYWSQLSGIPADILDGDDVLSEPDIVAMGFTKDLDTNETVRVNNLYSLMPDWNNAYSWGDHALEGYLTTESDPVFSVSAASSITGAKIILWDEAYSWGDHALEGYLVAADLVPSVGNWSLDKPNYVNYSSLDYFTGSDITGLEDAFIGWDKDSSDDITTAGGVINGELLINGNLTIVGEVFDAQVTNINITGDLNPSFDSAFSLGTPVKKWSVVYADNFEGSIDWLNVNNRPTDLAHFSNTPGYVYLSQTDGWDKNAFDDFSGSYNDLTDVPADILDGDDDYCSGGVCQGGLYVPGNLTIAGSYIEAEVTNMNISGNFYPSIDDTFDLGGPGNYWRVVYADTFAGDLDWGYLYNVPDLALVSDLITSAEIVSMVGNWSFDKPNYVMFSDLNYTTNTDCSVPGSCSSVVYHSDTIAWDKNAFDDFSGNYNDLSGAPTNLSQFNNDLSGLTDTNCSANGSCNNLVYKYELNYTTEADIVGMGFTKDTNTNLNASQISSMGFITLAEIPNSSFNDTNETVRVNNLYSLMPDWNNAYSWGDHALEGYLTTESDPLWLVEKNNYYNRSEVDSLLSNLSFNVSSGINITATDIANWNNAYGWGDHGLMGYCVNCSGNNTLINPIINLTDYYVKNESYNRSEVDFLVNGVVYNDTTINDRLTVLENNLLGSNNGVYLELKKGWNTFNLPAHVIVGNAFVPGLNVSNHDVVTVLASIDGNYSYLAYDDGSDWKVYVPGNSAASNFDAFPTSADTPDYTYHIYMTTPDIIELEVV